MALDWLEGEWVARDGDSVTLETWRRGPGAELVGDGRTRVGGEVVHTEALRVERRAAGVFYVATPSGQATTAFRLAESGPGHAVFVAPDHDFPKRIEYRRDGDRLHVRISGDADQRTAEWAFVRAGSQ